MIGSGKDGTSPSRTIKMEKTTPKLHLGNPAGKWIVNLNNCNTYLLRETGVPHSANSCRFTTRRAAEQFIRRVLLLSDELVEVPGISLTKPNGQSLYIWG